jgi:glycosyltransferase involved in cell wall biosynthesis
MGATVPATVKAFLIDQAYFISQHGWYVHIVTSPGPEMVDLRRTVANWSRVTLHEIPMERNPSPLKDLRAIAAWIRLLRKIGPQVVIVGTPKAALLGILSSRVLGTRDRVYLVRGLRLEGQKGIAAHIGALMERVTCLASTNVLCNSKSLEKMMVLRHFVPPKKVQVLGYGSSNGVGVDKFHPPSKNQRNAARREFGIDEDTLVVGFAGRLTLDKGLEEILAAIAIVQVGQPDVRLLIAGDWDSGELPPEVIRSVVGDSRVVFAGRVEDMVIFFHALDVFCLPSYREGMPNVNLEAASCGLPVVTTTATGCIDSVVSGLTGLTVAPRDYKALAESLLILLSDSDKRTALGLNGRSWVIQEFRQEDVWGKQLKFLDSLVPKE